MRVKRMWQRACDRAAMWLLRNTDLAVAIGPEIVIRGGVELGEGEYVMRNLTVSMGPPHAAVKMWPDSIMQGR